MKILSNHDLRSNYQSSSDKFEEVTSNNGAEKLSNPVKQAGKKGNLAAKS